MEQLGITVFDVAVIAVAIFGAAIGMSAGFVHAVLFIGSWIGAGWVALHYSQLVEPEILKLVQSAELARFGAMLVVFVLSLIVLVILTNALSRAIRLSPFNKPDRILGAAFGVICAWAAMGLAFLFYSYLGPKPLPAVIEGGATFPAIREMGNMLEQHLPPGFRSRLTQKPTLDPATIPTIPMPETPKPPQ
jgi:membrane protein required for colicin V production